MKDTDLKAHLNHHTTIHGVAENAKGGAIVMTSDDTPIYLGGVAEWDSEVAGESVVVSGTLRRVTAGPTPLTGSNNKHSAGVDSARYLLENPTWKLSK